MNVLCQPCTTCADTESLANKCCNPYTKYTGHNVPYTGAGLPILGIETCDSLNVALEKIEIKLRELQESIIITP